MNIRASVINRLDEPFDLIALQSALKGMHGLIGGKIEQALNHGLPPPRQREVEQETELESLGVLIGACFVLAQANITRALAILAELPEGDSCLPTDKRGRLDASNEHVPGTQVSQIAAIDGVANYFKHNDQWTCDWKTSDSQISASTIQLALDIGMHPGDPDNMLTAARVLGLADGDGVQRLAEMVGGWREALANQLRKHGV